ncbi:patj homolog [Ischnura elegans]|uniref:patj homolog n=1 Tax=Ischnura elegans TaxID=197161 RepID=UPI001ED86DF8|nr:patj homolog [Ischnura elegans]
MPLSGDISTALQLLEHIQHSIHASEDVKLESQTSSDLNLLISVLENPVLRGIVTIQDSLCELNQQLQHHPSILPADFEISPAGELVLSLPPSPPSSADIYDVGGRESGGVGTGRSNVISTGGFEFEDQRVPVATLSNSSSSGENVSSPQPRVGHKRDGGTKQHPGAHLQLQIPPRDEDDDDEDDIILERDDGRGGSLAPPLPQPPITTPEYAIEFQKAIGAASQGRDVHTIKKLFKPEGSSLGFSVVGLRSEEKGELGIFVQEIQPTGIAGRDGRLQEGDQILAIDGQPLDSNISHHQAISILQKARGLVELVVARNAPSTSGETTTVVSLQQHLPTSTSTASHPSSPPPPPPRSPPPIAATSSSSLAPSTLPTATVERSPSAVSDGSKAGAEMVLNTEWAQVEVIDLLNDGSGLGFGIIGGRSTGVVVKTILPTGVADRDGRLQSGDHILQIGDVNLRGMGSEQVAAVLRQSGSHVRLVVARPVEPTSPDYQALGSHAPIVPTKILGDPEELDRQLLQNGYDADAAFSGPPPPLLAGSQQATPVSSTAPTALLVQGSLDANGLPSYEYNAFTTSGSVLDPTSSVGLSSGATLGALEPLPEMEKFEVELRKDAHGLGITIAGYVCEKEELSGIFVKSISEGSAADLCGRIQVNDRIVEVDGRSLQGYTNHGAVEVLRGTGRTVRLCLERYLRGPKYEQLQQAIANSELLQGRQGGLGGVQRQQPLLSGVVPPSGGNGVISVGILPPPTPSSPSATSLPHVQLSSTDGEEDETTEIEPEGESHTTIDSAVLLEGLGGGGVLGGEEESSPHQALEALNMDVDVERLITTTYDGELDPAVEAAVKAKWSKIMGPDCEIVVAQLSKFGEGGGLGISLEGTVDVEGGREVRPHHYIRSILPEGPVGRNGRLRSGDELLEVNGCRLLGLNHVEVVANLKELPMHVRMVCARKSADAQPQHRLLIDTAQDRAAFAARSILGGSLQNLLPATDRLVKAKSDGSLASSSTATATVSSAAHTPGATSHAPTTPTYSSQSSSSAPGSSSGPSADAVPSSDMSLGLGSVVGLSAKMRSRSLEPLTGLAMWSSEPQVIELVKGERGLGFSILDYQDPMNPSETVIVIRSLVPGGVAQTDGRLVPGDRLLAVNDSRLENASLDRAVQALKGAPRGVVRIAVAKPLPLLPATSSEAAEDDHYEPEQEVLSSPYRVSGGQVVTAGGPSSVVTISHGGGNPSYRLTATSGWHHHGDGKEKDEAVSSLGANLQAQGLVKSESF